MTAVRPPSPHAYRGRLSSSGSAVAGILPLLRILALHYLSLPRNAPYLLGNIALSFPEWQGCGILGAQSPSRDVSIRIKHCFLFGSFFIIITF